MKARNELNACLYSRKMDEISITSYNDSNKYNAVCAGDKENVDLMLNNGMLSLNTQERILSTDSIKNVIYHFLLAASALAEACISEGMGNTEAITLSDLYIQKADICTTTDSLYRLYRDMCLDFTERMQEIRKEPVISLHIRKCIDYIYEHLGSDLSVKALAKNAGLDPAYLSRLFRQETGISLKRFVKEARVDTAENLLSYSDMSYLVIATSLGFSSQSSFISVFKEITGMTPKVYREKNYVIKPDKQY